MTDDDLTSSLHAWFRQELKDIFSTLLTPQIPTSDISEQFNVLSTKVSMIMATLADIQAMVTLAEAKQQELINLLGQALSGLDPATIEAIVARMQTGADAMQAAINAASSVVVPPVIPPPMPIPPGSPVIS